MDYAAKQLNKANSKLDKLNEAIKQAAELPVGQGIPFDEEVALWNERKELEAFINHLEPFVNKNFMQNV